MTDILPLLRRERTLAGSTRRPPLHWTPRDLRSAQLCAVWSIIPPRIYNFSLPHFLFFVQAPMSSTAHNCALRKSGSDINLDGERSAALSRGRIHPQGHGAVINRHRPIRQSLQPSPNPLRGPVVHLPTPPARSLPSRPSPFAGRPGTVRPHPASMPASAALASHRRRHHRPMASGCIAEATSRA